MTPIIIYVDDADYALPLLQGLAGSPQASSSHWLLVACAPRITHRASKWVSHSARENWRGKWADKLFAHLVPVLDQGGARVSQVLAKGPLDGLLEELQQLHGKAQVVDARRPKQPAPAQNTRSWNLPGTLAALGAMLGLVFEESMI
ncbi:hypothetical protein [Comamonas composti]|uniref:hypothetical protein n=1 Tax=Comamonas composti TaxID=408558 RepID=UPI00040175C3|nr:hypothetical protein [Comamonas composti]